MGTGRCSRSRDAGGPRHRNSHRSLCAACRVASVERERAGKHRRHPHRTRTALRTSGSNIKGPHDDNFIRRTRRGPDGRSTAPAPAFMPSLALTPRGHLRFSVADGPIQLPAALLQRLEAAFGRGSGHGLLELGAAEVGTALPADVSYWRDFAAQFVAAICTHPDLDGQHAPPPAPALTELDVFAAAAPPMTGAEYLTASVLEALWAETAAAFRSELAESKASIETFLQEKNPAWHLVGRVHFNLAENRRDENAPFAFLATYTTQLSTTAKPQHLPLGRALTEYAGAANKQRLLSLLLPVQRAAAECSWLRTMVEAGEIYHPLRWTP